MDVLEDFYEIGYTISPSKKVETVGENLQLSLVQKYFCEEKIFSLLESIIHIDLLFSPYT